MEVTVEKDRGFRQIRTAGDVKNEIGHISVDANFSPVERVSLKIEDTRIGQTTNFDKVILEIITNGTVEPTYALKEASRILVDHYNSFINDASFDIDVTQSFQTEEPEVAVEDEIDESGIAADSSIDGKIKIEDLNLSPRTTNALLNSGVKTFGGLKRLSALKLEEVKGLGKKGIEEINSILG
jgi:DNA-directed RNA polymerase subunit alpha